MALSNSSNVTKRIDVNRRLSFGEMDENFEQLKLVITDTGNLEVQLGDKVSTTVYDAKIADVDQSILDLENALIGTVSEEFVNQLESRITVNENAILTLEGDLDAIINDAVTATDSTWSSSKIDTEFSNLETTVTNQVNDSSEQINQVGVIGAPNWPAELTYDANDNLTVALYSNGTNRYRQTLSYDGTTGDLSSVLYEQSEDSGSTWTTIGNETLVYTNDTLTSTTWTAGA